MANGINVNVIPKPVNVEILDGNFILNENTTIFYIKNLENMANFLADYLKNSTRYSLLTKPIDNIEEIEKEIGIEIKNRENKNYITFCIDEKLSNLGSEGYSLNVSKNSILISSLTINGIFYGIQTLRQLLPPEIESEEQIHNVSWKIPCVNIKDYPRFPWRGFMFDVSRHFYPVKTIKLMLDMLAFHKMNVFHWHLINDQGWRIEIKKYPKLTEVGSKRKESQINGWLSKEYDGKYHEGYYTQEEIKDIVKYASERFIKVNPEINMPGHVISALASYPELSCKGGQFEVWTKFGINKDIYCAGNEKVFEFLEDVIDEIVELFPSDIIHIGGDEAPKSRWKECDKCQKRIQDENLKDTHELQVYFTNRMLKYIKSKGKIIMGWNEILGDNLDDSAHVQFWFKGMKKALTHMRKGRKFVMSQFYHVYLDYNYGLIPLHKTYKYEPIPKKLEVEFHENILGIETPIWTEWVENEKRLHWQVFPRFCAVAETGWTPKKLKNYEDFKKRLESMMKRFDYHSINYAKFDEVDPTGIDRIRKTIHRIRAPKFD